MNPTTLNEQRTAQVEAYLKPFVEAREARQKPFADVKEAMLKSLKENGNVLFNFTFTDKMNAGDGMDLIINTVKEAGLTPFVFEFAASDTPTFYPIPPRPSVEKLPQEQYDFQYNNAIKRMKEFKANVMILEIDANSDIRAYTDAARDSNVQLVLAVHDFSNTYEMKAQVSPERYEIVSTFIASRSALSKNSFIDRVKAINSGATDTPAVKIGKHI